MRLFFALVSLALACSAAYAQTIPMDTLVMRQVGPGMTYVQIVAPSVPWSIDILELDRTNPYLGIEMVEANDRRAGGYETVSSMAARNDGPEHHVVGAINGDFFGSAGDATNAGVVGGQMVRRSVGSPSLRPSIGFNAANAASISLPSVGGTLLTQSDTLTIKGYNESRTTNALILYNAFQGATTGTNAYGTEVVIRPTESWIVNDTVTAVVEQIAVGAGDAAIPDGWAVLSGNGAAATALGALKVGEQVRIVATVDPGLPRIEDLISGTPILIQDGQPYPMSNNSHNRDRHPRTAVGFNADTSRIYFMTVDGRQPSSVGMSNFEMRDFMMGLGITDAMGLDGGGSTTMVIRGEIANSPSSAERPVANGLLAISTAPVGPLEHIQAVPFMSSLFLGESVQISVVGADSFYNPVQIDEAALTFRVDPSLGTVTPDGVFTAAASRDEQTVGYVHVAYGALTDSVRVALRVVSRITVDPRTVVTDTLMAVPFTVRATDSGGFSQSVPDGRVTWQVLDPRIGSISSDGVFTGRATGVTQIVATYSPSIRDTADVEVQIGSGRLNIDPLDDTSNWQVTSERMDEVSFEAIDDPDATGGKALRVRYRLTLGDQPPSLQLRTRIPVYGVPDSLRMRVRTDGQRHIVRYLLENPSEEPLTVSIPRYANDTAFIWMPSPITRAVPSGGLSYPVVVTGIQIVPSLSGVSLGEETEGTLVFDDLWVSYPSGGVGTDLSAPLHASAGQVRVFPNPSSQTATVAFVAPSAGRVQVQLYDILGRLALSVSDEPMGSGAQTVPADVSGLPAGIYLVRATLDGRPIGSGAPLVVAH